MNGLPISIPLVIRARLAALARGNVLFVLLVLASLFSRAGRAHSLGLGAGRPLRREHGPDRLPGPPGRCDGHPIDRQLPDDLRALTTRRRAVPPCGPRPKP